MRGRERVCMLEGSVRTEEVKVKKERKSGVEH